MEFNLSLMRPPKINIMDRASPKPASDKNGVISMGEFLGKIILGYEYFRGLDDPAFIARGQAVLRQ